MKRAAPWWLGWLLVGGLAALFVGERVVAGIGLARALFSSAGVLAVLVTVAWRALSWKDADGETRRVQRWLLLAHVGCVLALSLYVASSEDGMRWLGIDFVDEEARRRWVVVGQVLWTMLLGISLLPVLGAQFALAEHRHAREASGVESFRVVEIVTSGVTVALAAALLFVVGYLASARDETLDLSYFKTATPGPSTTAMVASIQGELRVLLFFPEVNPVKDEALAYFRKLADATGRVRIEEYDRLASPRLAAEHQVVQDGSIVFFIQETSVGRLDLGSTLASARPALRALDQRFQNALFPVLRRRPSVYLTTGHGELNDSTVQSVDSELGGAQALNDLLSYLGYDPRELGLIAGSGNEIPADAAVVMVLGPKRPFLSEEMAALDRYLQRGGSLLLALDPASDFRMGQLEERLGVRYVPVPLADEEQHLRQRGDESDRRLLITNRYLSHASVTQLARAGPGAGVAFVGPGYLEATEGADPAPRFVVRSLASTFADASANYRFDDGEEVQEAYPLVAAIDAAPAPGDNASPAAPSARALVYASSSPFTEAVLVSLATNAALVSDGVRWLAREEGFAGAVATEEDVPIVHTQQQNVIWFHATILGAPALVLALGLVSVRRRRKPKGVEA